MQAKNPQQKPGSHARQRRNATWAVWHFLQGQSCGTRSISHVTTITKIQNAATAQPTWIEVRGQPPEKIFAA